MVVINNTPAAYSSVNGDLIYTVYESVKANDPVTYQNYKYVNDVYVGGVLVARLKAYPDPSNKRGLFNIGRIVRNYIAFQFNPTANFLSQQFTTTEFNLSVQCKFGEEYGGTLYTNLTLDSSRTFFNHYNGRLTTSETILTNYTDKPATSRPYLNYCSFTGKSYMPYLATTTNPVPVSVAYFGSLTGQASATITPAAANNLLILDISPSGVNQLFGTVINSGTDYYILTINGVSYRVNVYCEVKYTPFTLHFLNQFGGFESFDFPKVSRKTYPNIAKKSFQQQDYRIDANGISNLKTGNVMNDTKTSYAVAFTENLALNSDILTDAQYKWLKQLVLSPVVYFDDGVLVPVSVLDTNYEERKSIQDHITSLRVNIDLGKQLNTQYR